MFNQPPAMPPISGQAQAPQSFGSGRAPKPSVAPSASAKFTKSGNISLIKTVVIILLALLLVGALVLAYYFYSEYRAAKADVASQVNAAVITREKEITDALEAEFAKREKEPYLTFSGPSDYGSLSFKYPKTWSVYIAKDASKGGDFEAYLHPKEVSAVSSTTINALRVTIKAETYETANNRYKNNVKNGKLTSSVISVGGTDATRYDGTLPSGGFVGSVVVLKIRDKTATIQTDAEIYREDFNQIISSITFNE